MVSPKRLTYYMAHTNHFSKGQSFLVVGIVGDLTMSNAELFQECVAAIIKTHPRQVILNFRDIPARIDLEFVPLLRNFHDTIQRIPADLKLCGVHPELRKILRDHRTIQDSKILDNLAQALESLSCAKVA